MRIITSGSKYLDIDAYAGCIAYAELLQTQGIDARAVSTAPLNESVPQIVRDWQAPLTTNYSPSPSDTYTLVDVSNPDFFEAFVDQQRTDEIIDHHPGHEQYWQERIGDRAIIEHVGSACTQVYEKWLSAGLADQINQTTARLLMCGILDNTLNFGADISCDRDRQAYDQLREYANLPNDWEETYFNACQQSITANISHAIAGDSKSINFKTFPRTMMVGQCTVWDAGRLAHDSFGSIKQALTNTTPDWAMNIIGINDGKSHFVSDVPEVQTWLQDTLKVHFDDNVAVSDRTWLRKEIMKADIDLATKNT